MSTVGERLAILEEKVASDHQRLQEETLPELDQAISRAYHEACDVGDRSAKLRDEAATEVHKATLKAKDELKHAVVLHVQEVLKNSPELIKSALAEIVKTTVLRVRPATRDEIRNGDSIAFRQAARGEV